MITDDKITEFFCAIDDFCKDFEKQVGKTFIYLDDKVCRSY